MLTNNSTNKLKASKSSRDLVNFVNESEGTRKFKLFEKTGEGDRDNNEGFAVSRISLSSKGILSRERGDTRLKPRVHSRDEFHMAQGGSMDRRSANIRGRGGGFSRKMERENDSNSSSRGRFQESLNSKANFSDVSTYSTKYASDGDNKSRMDHAFNILPEDSRISKTIRRLSREDDSEKFIVLCQQLQESLMAADNARYIRRAFDDIASSLRSILHRGPGVEAKNQISKCLGRVGYVLIDQDFKRYVDWIFSQYGTERVTDVKMLLLKAMIETLRLDSENPRLKDYSTVITAHLQAALENTDLPELTMATVDVIMSVTESYPTSFNKYFRDTVDILVGWHIDGSHSENITYYASHSLLKLGKYWVTELPFSVTLLGQFLEDMEADEEDLVQFDADSATTEEARHSLETCLIRITGLIKVFNTVAKCLGDNLNPAQSQVVSWNFLTDNLSKMLRTVIKALHISLHEDLIVTANECCFILLSLLQSRTSPAHEKLYELIDIQLICYTQLADVTIISMLRNIAKIIREVSGNLPMEFVQTLLQPSSPILKLRFSPSIMIQSEVLAVYHALLNLKNIPLLQEAYRNVLGDLEMAYKVVLPSIKELVAEPNPHAGTNYNPSNAEFVIMFHLKALTDLANATNSIIGMWALNPSILELLAVLLQPLDSHLSPHLQHSILFLLHSHCSKSNNFVSTSDFVTSGRDQVSICNTFGLPATLGSDARAYSPTSKHFCIILRLLTKLLSKETKEEILLLVLSWSREVFYHSEAYFHLVYGTEEFDNLISVIVNAGHSSSKVIISRVADNIEQLLSIRDVEWKPSLLTAIIDVCLFHSNSTVPQVRLQMSRVLPLVPWDIMIMHVDKTLHSVAIQKKVDSNMLSLETLNIVSRNHIARGSCGEMHQQQFKKFMGYLLQGIDNGNGDWLREMFCRSWPLQSFASTERKSTSLFGSLALISNSVLLLWATWEAAQLCVRGKLRTPLGKALETFTSIEGAIKNLARELNQNILEIKSDKSPGLNKTVEQRRVRLLLEFLEHLEKAIHNAAEGCATAMLPPPKPIRSFFHTNKNVCGEWLKRIRMAVIVVAIRAGQATTAVRHGHCLLQGLVDSNSTQGVEFEQAAMYVCWALCKLREPEAIQGLYAWCREVSNRRFYWLKASCQQAAGKFEVAAEEYRTLLEQSSPRQSPTHNVSIADENIAPTPTSRVLKVDPDPQILGFMADQLAECYKSVQNWSDLHKWKQRELDLWSNQNGGTPLKYLLNNITISHVKALQEFEEKNFLASSELMKWPSNEKPLEQLSEATKSWNCYKTISFVNNTLTTIALQLAARSVDFEEIPQWTKMLENCFTVSQCYLQESIRNPPSEFLHDAIVTQYATAGLQSVLGGNTSHNSFNLTDRNYIKNMNTSLLTQVLWWTQCFEHLRSAGNQDGHSKMSQFCLEVVQTARKEGNYGIAQKVLLHYLEKEEGISISGKRKLSLEEVASNVLTFNICDEKYATWNVQRVKAFTEVAKLLFCTDKPEKAVEICVFTAMGISKHLTGTDCLMKERSARLLLTLSKWLQEKRQGSGDIDMGNLLVIKLINAEKLRNNLATFSVDDGPISVPPSDVAIGYLLQLATNRCPSLAKTWEQYATWCYRWGRRMVETDLATSQLSDVDKAAVQQLMPRGTTIEEFEKVTAILSQTRSVAREEDIEGEDINTSEMIKSQLQNVRTLATASSQQLDSLVGIWRNTQQRIYSYLQQAATAYFKYLDLCQDTGSDDCKTIIATLRLLRLIVKHALELQDVLESGLGSTPVRPWKVIIPQLFSRLSHPEPYVRTRVSELLCRVAQDAPHLITFPAVVGAVAGGARLRDITRVSTSRLFSAGLSQPEDEEEEEEDEEEDERSNEEVSVLQNCFLAMVDTLSKQAPVAISQVQLVVSELHRITLLWDELWLGTLVQHHAEISRRLAQLEAEINRVDDNLSLTLSEKDSLIVEKHRIILKPLVFILEQLHAITSVPPETPHEVWFQEKFNGYITEALHKLKSPTNARKPQESWHPLKVLQSRLQQRANKRAAYAINMSDVSPALAALKDTVIAMPGVTPSPGKIITIAAVDNYITILPTKTKPKKLIFHGNDGRMYTYLFKGLEDLHLDERIMQFLSIANTMMSSERGGSTGTYRARHYSVIPLGPRSGLISWVDGVTPLFGLYKRWQQREVAAGSLKERSSSNHSSKGNNKYGAMNLKTVPSSSYISSGQVLNSHGNGAPVMRPSEMFYSKLTPLLKEKGITNLDNRKEWPLPILRQVLTELMEETPKDLLAKELWGHSVNAGGWWRSTRTYSYSVAVMSIIGYIIGLGDRHLDNVLVDLSTGEVVHIDYNVCFEKGKTLRVPEKVPFRMTPNIRTALGVTGVEGIFRLTCEHVLKVMKKGRETLLTLLEAFVYDPLIDWTPGNEAGYTGAVYGRGHAVATETKQSRKELEHEVTRAMFCVRITEIKADWLKNRDDVLDAIPELVAQLNTWLQIQNNIKAAEESLQDCHQQIALVKEAEAQSPSSNHPLYTLSMRYAKHRRAKDALDKARIAIADKVEECDRQLTLRKAALTNIRGPQLSLWHTDLNYPTDKDSHMVFDLVKEFLQNAGQGQMVAQCEQSETELGQLEQQQDLLIRTCLHLLSQYADVSGLYPASYLNKHRSVCFRRWALHLLNNLSLESVEEVKAQVAALLAPPVTGQHILSSSFQLQSAVGEANLRLKKSYERLTNEGLPENAMLLEAAYVEARTAISAFPLTEQGAALALECVNVTALCALNRKYLMMEAAAFCAGDCLVDLMSREGDWFLDELYNVSTLVTELSSMIPDLHVNSVHSVTDTRIKLVLQCLQSSHSIYKGLLELNYNFHTIILPEALKTMHTEEPTVLAMVQELGQMIVSVGSPLSDLLAQLEKHLRCIIMEMDSPHADALQLVSILRARFEAMLHPTPDANNGDDSLSPGQMLLMGFNGLFEKLQLDGSALVSALDTLDTPSCWKKVDQVWEAKGMAAPIFKDATRGVLEDIFLIKRLQTMQEFFSLCEQMTRTSTIVDDDRLNKPIRRFTADYVSRQLLGVLSQTLALALCLLLQRIGLNVTVEVEQRDIGAECKVPLEELCRKAVDMCLKTGRFTGTALAQASSLTSNLEATWRRREVARHLQQDLDAKRSTLQRLQLQLTAYHWLHEDSLQGVAMTPLSPLSRSNFMMELRKTSSALITMQPRLCEMRDQQNALVGSVAQRLKWAAGANPAVMEVLAAFESAVAIRNERLLLQQRMATDIGTTCNSLLQHEALRTRTTEATLHDNSFVQLLEQCEQCCILVVGYDQSITATEESLVQLLTPEGSIDNTWIHNAEILISDNVKSLQQRIVALHEALVAALSNIRGQAGVMRSLLDTHNKLMADVKNLVKSMVKYEDNDLSGLQDYWSSYRIYFEQFSLLTQDLTSEDLDIERIHAAQDQLKELKEKTETIYEELLGFAVQHSVLPGNGEEGAKPRRPPLLRQESVCLSPRRGVPTAQVESRKGTRDPHTGKELQEKNAYAVGVWRRVRTKLEGRDPDLGRKATVQEQVDYVIREATSLDNLALLYEGWTPWV